MEGIVRHVKKSNPFADIVMMHFVDPGKMEDYRAGREPDVIRNHNLVATYYDIPVINLAKEVTERIDQGEFTWKDDFKDLHPSPFGQGVYANSITGFLDHAFSSDRYHDDKRSANVLPQKLKTSCYDNGTLIDISSIKKAKGWHVDHSWAPKDNTGVRPNYVNVPMLISETPGSTLKTTFTGNAVGIAVAAGQDAGMIEYRVDKNEWKKLNLFTPWSKGLHLPWYYTLAVGLTHDTHQLEIRIADDMDERSAGHACRIRYVYVNRL